MGPIHWHSVFFLLFALAACGCAVAVVVSSNIVRMAVYLVASLAAVAGLFFLAGADFLGAVQLMVYVGGTLVLLVFGVMLTARGPFVSLKTGGGQWIVGVVLGAALLAVLLQTVVGVRDWTGDAVKQDDSQAAKAQDDKAQEATSATLGLGLMGVRTDRPEAGPAASQPTGLSGYLLVFEIISVHLLVVLVGAAFLARAKRHAKEMEP
jgi:NADH-quinone oxidoreductase subunit J